MIAALQPFDRFNQILASNVHPDNWQNPTPKSRYHLVVIGAGTAGLVAAAGAAGLGAKVALIERELMGGDCLNVGCVPSKAIIRAARAAAAVHDSSAFGVHIETPPSIDFAALMERMRKLRSSISPHDSAARFRDLGIDVYLGSASFKAAGFVDVAGQSLRFKRAVIATGARAAKLPIEGLESVNALTNETFFSLTQLPQRLTVIGGGPIGSEMAQSMARLGSRVTLIEQADHLLSREDPDAARVVQESLRRDGVNVVLRSNVVRFQRRGNEKVTVYLQSNREHESVADEILISIGRAPNVDGLGLETVGVHYDANAGITVNDRMQSSNPMIYAAGDVASKYKFTHAADYMARIVIGNALFMGRSKASRLVIPWCTYTSPELAQVGLLPEQAAAQGIKIDTYVQPLSGVDRAILDSETEGFVKIHVRRGTDKIVGATVVAEHAGEWISELTMAMTHGLGLKKIAATIHPYPTQSDAIRKLGDQYNKTRLTPWVAKLLKRWLAWTG